MPRSESRLPNLGPLTSRRLAEVGIETMEDLRALGAVEAFARLKFRFGREISLNALWGMEAALAGTDWRSLPDSRKNELRAELAARSSAVDRQPAG